MHESRVLLVQVRLLCAAQIMALNEMLRAELQHLQTDLGATIQDVTIVPEQEGYIAVVRYAHQEAI